MTCTRKRELIKSLLQLRPHKVTNRAGQVQRDAPDCVLSNAGFVCFLQRSKSHDRSPHPDSHSVLMVLWCDSS